MEQIVIVDEDDNFIGEEDKEKCHDGSGILHRAFLAMVFTVSGELVLTRRSRRKRLWPGFWDGTVASHVVKGEDYVQATRRRLIHEIGLVADNIKYLFKFRYRVGYKGIGSENEICAVTRVDGIRMREIVPNKEEISEVDCVHPCVVLAALRDTKDRYAPWFILAVEKMCEQQLF